MTYFDALCKAMAMLAEQPNAVFMGQAVACEGTAMYTTLRDVPMEKRLEMPVAEELQAGMATGMALDGLLPISIFPRWNFLLLATNQLINHLDKLPLYSDGGYRPKVIVRTAVATADPLDPGPQHLGDMTRAFSLMLQTVRVVVMTKTSEIIPSYHRALMSDGSFLMVEHSGLYNT